MLSNKSYDVLKWLVLIAMPAISVFIQSVGVEIGISDPETLVMILNALTALLGTLIGVSSYQYKKNEKAKDTDGE